MHSVLSEITIILKMAEKISKWRIFHLKKCRSHDNILLIMIENRH